MSILVIPWNGVTCLLLALCLCLQVGSLCLSHVAPRWNTISGFLSPLEAVSRHSREVVQKSHFTCSLSPICALAGSTRGHGYLENGRHHLLGSDAILLFSQADGNKKCSDHLNKDTKAKEKYNAADDKDNAKSCQENDVRSNASGTVRVMYSGGSGENVCVEEGIPLDRKGKQKARGGNDETVYYPARKNAVNPHKEWLYENLMKLFSFVSDKLKSDNEVLHGEITSLIHDLKWDVWSAAGKGHGSVTEFSSVQLERARTITEKLKVSMGEITAKWKEVIETSMPLGRLPFKKLIRSLGVQDERDATEYQLLLDELIHSYKKEKHLYNWTVLQAITQYTVSRVAAVVDAILPCRPVANILELCSWVKESARKLSSWLKLKSAAKVPFNEEGIFKYYDMPRLCIHTPEDWPREYAALPYKGGGSWRLTFLGTGSRKPTKTRMTSAILFSRRGEEPLWLFDCGESAINRLRKAGFSALRVKKIFLTHLHGDHCFGIFSFLYGSTNAAPLEVYGPSGTAKLIADVIAATSRSQTIRTFVVNELVSPGEKIATPEQVKNSDRAFKVNYIMHDETMHYTVYEDSTCVIKAAPLVHTINTVGYVVQEKLEQVKSEKAHRPRKFVLCQDTADSRWLEPLSQDADLLIHEATINAPTNSGSEMLMRLARQQQNGKIAKDVIDKLDKLVLTEEMKFQVYQSTIGNLCYYYDRKTRSLREEYQSMAMNKETDTSEEAAQETPMPGARSEAVGKESIVENIGNPNWTDVMKSVASVLRQYGNLQAVEKRVSEVETLGTLITQLRSAAVNGTDSIKSRGMQDSMRVMAISVLTEEGYALPPGESKDPENSLRVSQAIDGMAHLIFQYWAGLMGRCIPLKEDKNYGQREWETLYNEYAKFSGHSTCIMAGRFAATIRARQLILTHFSQNHPDELDRESVLTMARVAQSALRGYYQAMPRKEAKQITVGTAWDLLTVTL